MKNRPPGFGPPTAFERYVAASKSGNVNSAMMLNFMKGKVIPLIRRHGVSTKDSFLVNLDRHASHESLPIFDLLKTENGEASFFPSNCTDLLQYHDARNGPFQKLKTTARKDIDTWAVFLKKRNQKLALEDFPFVIHRAHKESIKADVSDRGLKAIGFQPWKPDIVLKKLDKAKKFSEYEKQFLAEAENDSKNSDKTAAADLQEDQEEQAQKPDETQEPDNVFQDDGEWYETSSQPDHNLSPVRRGTRLRQHPNTVVIDGHFELNDFARQERHKQIMGLA